MKVWLPYLAAGTGVEIFHQLLADALRVRGHIANAHAFPKKWEYMPWRARSVRPPFVPDVILTSSWSGFAFARAGVPMVTVEHLCVHDPAYRPFKTTAQAAYHRVAVAQFERWSFSAAEAIVAVSEYTARATESAFPGVVPRIIRNGVDSEIFKPLREPKAIYRNCPFRVLFIGNLTRRKGADLLVPIIEALGPGFELRYTSGLRVVDQLPPSPNRVPLGRLSRAGVREELWEADVLLLPSRLEGLPLVALESMACGTPVIASRASSHAEVIIHGVDGVLCTQDDLSAYVDAIKALAAEPQRLHSLAHAARARIEREFTLKRMVDEYVALFNDVIS